MANNMKEYLRWLCSNLDAFEFRTERAQDLRDEIRSWRYSDDDEKRAEELYTEFFQLFSDNPFMDMVAGDIRYMAERCALPLSNELQTSVSVGLKGSAISGRSLRAYGGIKESKATVWLKVKATAARARMEPLLKNLTKHLASENIWRKAKRLSGSTLIVLALFLASVAYGVKALIPLVLQLIEGAELEQIFDAIPARELMSSSNLLMFAAGWILLMLLLTLLRSLHILSAIRGSLVWLFGYKRSLRRRTRFMNNLLAGFSEGSLQAKVNEMGRVFEKAKTEETGDSTQAYFAEPAKIRLFYKKKHWRDHTAAGWWNGLYQGMNRRSIRFRFLYFVAALLTLLFASMLQADRDILQDRIEEKEENERLAYIDSVTAELGSWQYYEGEDGLVGDDGLIKAEVMGFESSQPFGSANITYIPEFALDDSRESGWATPWNDEPVWLKYTFPKSQFRGLQLANGCQYDQGVYYYTFHRAAEIRMEVYCDGEYVRSFYATAEDITDWQFFLLDQPLEATEVYLYIDSTHSGSDAVFLSEVVPLIEE